jgi:hypothetical protein
MDDWFATWIRAMESPLTQIDSLGEDEGGTVVVSYGNKCLVGATQSRAIAYA